MKPDLLSDSLSVWNYLTRDAGLDVKFHDRPIIDAIARDLGVRVPIGLGEVPVEKFLSAFFRATEPFSRMMEDLLGLFEQAGAKRSDSNLQVEFDFGTKERFSFDVENFREWLKVLRLDVRSVDVGQWDFRKLWDLMHALTPQRTCNAPLPQPAARWLDQYSNGRISTDFPDPPESSDPILRSLLKRAWNVWVCIMREMAAISPARERLHEIARRTDEGQVRLLGTNDTDLWGASVGRGLYSLSGQLTTDPSGELRQSTISNLTEVLDSVPTVEEEREVLVECLYDFLNLPVWKHRYELYSAWIATQILDALSEENIRIHLSNGTLTFSFSGVHFATIDQVPAVQVWAELRSPIHFQALGHGRKKNIQPDYTLIAEPIHDDSSAVLVVECKQYRKASAKNFIAAVTDYARARPRAVVALVNYGPARNLQPLSDDVSARVHILGEIYPGQTGVQDFKEIVRRAVPRAPHASAVRDVQGTDYAQVVLEWERNPRDLDLHVSLQTPDGSREISFADRGTTEAYPWAELDRDVQSPGSAETIRIARMEKGVYSCWVVNYSRDAPFANAGATIRVTIGGFVTLFRCPSSGSGHQWKVFSLDTSVQSLEVENVLS